MSGYEDIMIDNGSGMMKAGFIGDDAPVSFNSYSSSEYADNKSFDRAVFPTIVGKPKHPGIMVGMCAKDIFIGDEAQAKRGILYLKNPLPRDQSPVMWDCMEEVWKHTFRNELRVDSKDTRVMLSNLHYMDDFTFEKIVSIMFETFEVQGLCVVDCGVLSLQAKRVETGVVLDCGDGLNRCVCVDHSIPIPPSLTKMENPNQKGKRDRLTGNVITRYLSKLWAERGYVMTTNAEMEILRDIKEKLCYVALDYDKEYELATSIHPGRYERDYELPRGSKMTIGHERFQAPEVLFQPKLCGYNDVPSITDILYSSIRKAVCSANGHYDESSNLATTLFKNIHLAGGSTMFPGIENRVALELSKKLHHSGSKKPEIKIHAPPERKYTCWIGGSMIGSIPKYRDKIWIDRFDFDEHGVGVGKKKCKMVVCESDLLWKMKDPDEDERLEFIQSNQNDVIKLLRVQSTETGDPQTIEIFLIHYVMFFLP